MAQPRLPGASRLALGQVLPHGSRETCDSDTSHPDLKGKEAEERRW